MFVYFIKKIHSLVSSPDQQFLNKMTKLDQKRINRKEITQKVSPLIQNHLDIFMLAKKKISQ